MNRSQLFHLDKITLFTIITITAIATILSIVGEKAAISLRYEHGLWQSGEWWRVFSGHFVHLGWTHLLLNLAALWLIAVSFYQHPKPTFLLVTAIALTAMGTSAGLIFFSPEITWYVGLSGMLHGLIVIGAAKNITIYPLSSKFILLGVFLKILWEQLYADNNVIENLIGGNIVYDAHLYGAISGAIIIIFLTLLFAYKNNQTTEQNLPKYK